MSDLDCDPARGFVALPPAIFDLDLTPGAFRTLAELCRMADATGRCWPSLGQLGSRLGRARATVSAYVEELRAAGLVVTESQRTANGYNYRLRYTVTFWADWRRALAARRGAAGLPRDRAERRVWPAERPYDSQNQIQKTHPSRGSHMSVAEKGAEPGGNALTAAWSACVGGAQFPDFDRWPGAALLAASRAAVAAPCPAPADPGPIRAALSAFFDARRVAADPATLDRLAQAARDSGGDPAAIVARLAAIWQPHWRRPPTAEQLSASLAGIDGPGRAATARRLLQSYLRRWELTQRRLPPLAAQPRVPPSYPRI